VDAGHPFRVKNYMALMLLDDTIFLMGGNRTYSSFAKPQDKTVSSTLFAFLPSGDSKERIRRTLSSVRLVFTEGVKLADEANVSLYDTTAATNVAITASVSRQVLELKLSSPLTSSHTYSVIIPDNSVTDIEGNKITGVEDILLNTA
jgi:hypothetical protein